MDDSRYRVSLDIHRQTTQAHIAVKKGDTARQIVAVLTENGKPYQIGDECYAVFTAKKPDGSKLYNSCTIQGNKIVYQFTEQTVSAAGQMVCEFQLYGDDGKLITSPRIAVIVSGTVYEGGSVESSDEFSALAKAMTELARYKANGLKGDEMRLRYYNGQLQWRTVNDAGVPQTEWAELMDAQELQLAVNDRSLEQVLAAVDGLMAPKAVAYEVGGLDPMTGETVEDGTSIRSEVIRLDGQPLAVAFPDGIVCLPVGYNEDGAVLAGATEKDASFTVSRFTYSVRLVFRFADGRQITDVAELAQLVTVYFPEVYDLRYGVDGSGYRSAGEAVRTQFARMGDRVGAVEEQADTVCGALELEAALLRSGAYEVGFGPVVAEKLLDVETGAVLDRSGQRTMGISERYIPIRSGVSYEVDGGGNWFNVLHYDAGKRFLWAEKVDFTKEPVSFSFEFEDGHYVRVSAMASSGEMTQEVFDKIRLRAVSDVALEPMANKVAALEKGSGAGQAGGYYVPSVAQKAEGTMEVAFTASREGMPEVAAQTVVLPVGPKGDPGDNGVSPVVTVADIDGGHRITITDVNGTKTVDVMDSVGVLFGKTAVFDGDSICAAGTDKPDLLGAWAGRIGSRNGMTAVNYAVGGGTITAETYTSGGVAKHWISRSIDTIYQEHPTLDYLILEGGTNDADTIGDITGGSVPDKFGSYTDDDYTGSYDDTTFCGAVESLFFKALSYYPGAYIGVVIPMQMGYRSSASANRRAYFDVLIKLCKKWAIPYIDLWCISQMNANLPVYYDPALTVDENTAQKYYQDGQHPTSKGYSLLTPKIEAWMRMMTAIPECEEGSDEPGGDDLTYTNLVPTAIDTDGNIFNGTGYKDGVYLSGGNPTGNDAAITTTGFIPWTPNTDGTVSPIYVKGATLDSAVSHCRLCTYAGSDKSYGMQMKQEGASGTYAWGTHFTYETLGDQYYKITAVSADQVNKFVRLSLKGAGANLIITIGEPIE